MKTRLTPFLGLFPFAYTITNAQTYTWEDKANGQVVADCNGVDPGGEFLWPNNNNWSQAQVIGNNPCSPFLPGFVRQPSNWTMPDYPDSPTAVVVINAAPGVDLDTNADIATLNVTSGNKLRILGYSQLNVHGGTLTNDGTIDIEDFTAGTARLNLAANTLLTGSGQTRFVTDDDCWIVAPSESEVLTIDHNHEVIAIGGTIPGESRFSASFLNNGTLTADQGGVQLDTYDKINRGLVTAVNGGTMRFSSVGVDNVSGTMTAGEASTVVFHDTVVTGGTLQGPGLFDITSSDATFDKVNLAEGSTVLLGSYDVLTLRETLNNNGVVKLEDIGSGEAELRIDRNVMLAGSGTVLFASNDDCVINSVLPSDVLTIGENQTLLTGENTIAGSSGSRVEALFVNNGTITADGGGLLLNINDKTNNSRIEAVNGGQIVVSGISIYNANGTIHSGELSELRLNDAIISGGILDGGGPIQITSSDATLSGGVTLASESRIVVDSSDALYLTGTFTNNGVVELLDNGSSVAELKINGNVLLDGSGMVLFNTNDDNIITAVDPDNDVLTVGQAQTLLTGPTAIAHNSNSRVVAAMINEGTITAETGGLQFDGKSKVNNGLMNTLDGGIFRVRAAEIDNTNGEISLDEEGQLLLSEGTIRGGMINGNGQIISQSTNDFLMGPLEIGPATKLSAGTSRVLHVAGEITNNGVMEITDTGAGVAYLRIDGNTSLLGSGKVVFNSNDDNYFDSVDPAHILTNGPDHTLTTNSATRLGESRLRMALVNQGVVEAREGSLTLDELSKTNNGIFRATGGGELEILNADSLLTNYDPATGTLSGGRWEAIGGVIDLQGAVINTIAPGTEVILNGDSAGIPQLPSLNTLEGKLRIDNGATLVATGDVALKGVLEFGLADGASNGFDTTGLAVEGDLDFTGCVIDVADLGLSPGGYEVITWSETSTITGTPTLRNAPPGTSFNLDTASGSLTLIITGEGPIAAPEILGINYDSGANTTVIIYQSVDGEAFGVKGGTDLGNLSPLPDTEMGNGGTMQYVHSPVSSPGRYFYQLFRK